jgi:hypothetical protein
MFKLIKRLIGISIIAVIVFLALSLWQGGKPFRWFGNKTEKAGEVIKAKSEELGAEADRLKKKTEDMKGKTTHVTEGVKKAKEKIRDITGSVNDK